MNYNALLHLDSNDPEMLGFVCRNANNYLNGLPNEKFELQIVANGGGASHFTKDHHEVAELVKPLMAKGVKFKICANALREQNIDPASLIDGCEVVPAGLVEVVKLQRAGFAYIKP